MYRLPLLQAGSGPNTSMAIRSKGVSARIGLTKLPGFELGVWRMAVFAATNYFRPWSTIVASNLLAHLVVWAPKAQVFSKHVHADTYAEFACLGVW